MEIMIPLLVISGLIAINGIFVAAEFAIAGVPRATIENLASKGQRAASLVRDIINNPRLQDRYIATAQLGITFASLGLGMYGEHILADWIVKGLDSLGASRWIAAHTLAGFLSIIILTYFHIVLGEMVPKSLALLSAERTALWITTPMCIVQYALYPLVIGLNAIGNGILAMMGVRREFSAGNYHTPEEIEFLVRESEEGGLLKADAGKVIRDLFEFGELTSSEVMVPRVHVVGLPLEASPDQILSIVLQSHHTRYPVYNGSLDNITGMIHIKDIFRLLREGISIQESNIRAVPYIPETAELDQVLTVMRKTHAQMVVVMDEHGGTAGIITLEDLFDEVIGPIDEDLHVKSDMTMEAEGRLRAAGTVRLNEVGEAFGTSFEADEVNTISGLVLMMLGRPPRIGDAISYRNIHIEVIDVEGHGVKECYITYEPGKDTGFEPSI